MMRRGAETEVRRRERSWAGIVSTQRNLGVTLREIDADVASGQGLKEASGLLVVGTMPGGAAEKAGLLWGDVIVEVNYTPMQTLGDLGRALASHAPWTPSRFLARRAGNLRYVEVWLDNRTWRKEAASPS